MPYLDIPDNVGVPYVRVTEATGAFSCPRPAYLDHVHPQRWERPKRKHYSAVRGTSVHDVIESYIVRTEGLPKRLRKPRNKEDLEMIWKDIERHPSEQVLKFEIQRCMINFYKWWQKAKLEYEIEVLYCEKKVWSTTHKVAGTLDIIAKMKIHGTWWIVILDWKSSKEWAIEYKFQTSGYRGLVDEMVQQGKLELPNLPMYDRQVVVILGSVAPLEVWAPYDFPQFLNCVRMYRNPKNHATKQTCVYCGDYYRCKEARHYEAPLEYIPRGANK